MTDWHAPDKAEQLSVLQTRTFPYDPRTQRVLAGPHKGQPVWDAIQAEVPRLLRSFAHVTVTHVTVRPWQRWWQRTPAKRLIPSCPLSGTTGGPG
ncbi:hypothetical protein [Deinococcus sp.]|uniref:hypothetical protein n=1 Tax=Deinococcus sp. TaxID=47478 RepID=UPI0025C15B12|nr:hypothetical protein [Deinococcus sp.]